MNKIKQDRNKNIKNIYDENNRNDERNINLDCPASNLGNRDVRNSPQTVVLNKEKSLDASEENFSLLNNRLCESCIPIGLRETCPLGQGCNRTATLNKRNRTDRYKNNDEKNLKDRCENKNGFKNANDRTGEYENKTENKTENKNENMGAKNDMKRIEKIIGDYRPLILASISRYCNLPGFFDDLYQDGVVEVIEAMKEYDPAKGTVGGYLKTRLKLFYINKYKRLIRRETDDIENIKAKDQPSVMAIADHENKMLVARLLSILDPDERTVIELTFLMDMRASEVSKIMGISKRKVYYLKETGMKKLQKMSTRENLSMRDVVNDEDVYKGGGKKTYNNME